MVTEQQQKLMSNHVCSLSTGSEIDYLDALNLNNYLLKTLFYRSISEDLSDYINGGDASIQYTSLFDSDITEAVKNDTIKTMGYFIYPSQLFVNVAAHANRNYNLGNDLKRVFSDIEESSTGYSSEDNIKGIFCDFDVNSFLLGLTPEDRNIMLAGLLNSVSDLGLQCLKGSTLSDKYTALIETYANSTTLLGLTSKNVSKLLIRLSTNGQKSINKVYDPACGSGSLLIQAKELLDTYVIEDGLFGQEINHRTYNIARMNLLIHGVNYTKFNIKHGDTLDNPYFVGDEPFDAIVSNPSYSMKWVGDGNPDMLIDDRFSPVGVLAPKNKADLAFILHALHYLSNKGRAAIVCHPGVLYRQGAEKKIRQYLVDNNFIEAVIALSPGSLLGTPTPPNILVLSKHKTRNEVQFIDAVNMYDKGTNSLLDEHIEKVMDMFNGRCDVCNLSKLVPYREIVSNYYNLSVKEYINIATRQQKDLTMNGLEKQIQDIENKYKIKIPTTIADTLRELDAIRKDGGDIDYGGLGKVIDVLWRSTTYGEPPRILCHRIVSGVINLVFYGDRTKLEWDGSVMKRYSIDLPKGSSICELMDWAFGDFYDKEWRRKVVWESIVSRGKN